MSQPNASYVPDVTRRRSDSFEGTTARLYRVQRGDDLRSIAEHLYGLPDYWVFIHEANAREIAKGEGIRPGQVLYIPDL